MAVVHHFFGLADILFVGLLGSIDHDVGVASVRAFLAVVNAGGVIEVQADRHRRRLSQGAVDGYHHVGAEELGWFYGSLYDDRCFLFDRCVNHRFKLKQVGDVERAHSPTFFCRGDHDFLCIYDRHL